MTGQDIALNAVEVQSRCADVDRRVRNCEAGARGIVSAAEDAISDASGVARIEVDAFLASAEVAARNGLAAVDAIRTAMAHAAAEMSGVDAAVAVRTESYSGVFARGAV